MRSPTLSLAAGFLITSAAPAFAGLADVQGIWQLNNDLNEQGGGTALSANGFVPAYSTVSIGGQDATVLDLAPLDPAQTLVLPNETGPNGGPTAAFTNQWTIVMDINLETITTFQSLVQTNAANGNDVDIFVRPGGARGQLDFGPNVSDPGAIAENAWYRLALTCGNDGNGGALSCIAYIDGVQTTIAGVPQVAANAFEGIFSLETVVNLFSDESSETDDMLVNSIAFWGEALSGGEIAVLGAASAAGIELPADPKICPSNLLLTASGDLPSPTVELAWAAAEGLDSTGIEVLLDDVLLATIAPDAEGYTHMPAVTPTGGFVDLVYTVRMTGGADSDDCDSLTATASFFTGELGTDLVLYLPLDGDGADLSGLLNNGTVNGVPTFSTGRIANAMTMTDPADPHQFVSVPADDDLNFGTDVDFTVSVWVNNSGGFPNNQELGGSGADPGFLSNKDWNSGANTGWILAASPDGRWQWNFNTEGGTRSDYDPVVDGGLPAGPDNQRIDDGNWHHLLVSHDRDGDAVMYYDGQQVATRDISGHTGTVDAGFGVGVGTDGSLSATFPSYFPGSLDEVAIWRRVVTSQEVANLFAMGQGGVPLVAGAGLEITDIDINTFTKEVTITFNGTPGVEYVLWASDDLEFWGEIDDGVGSSGVGSELIFTDSEMAVPGKRFYQLREFAE